MTDPNEKTSSLPERALGKGADEFATSASGAGERLGQAALILADKAVVVAKAISVFLEPIRLLVYGYEQLKERFIPLVQDRLAMIPDERRASPPLRIAGPTIEAAKFATDEPEICQLFANLLATSMDTATRNAAHPSFVDLIKHLSPDEARMLRYMATTRARTTNFAVVDIRILTPPKFDSSSIHVINATHLDKG